MVTLQYIAVAVGHRLWAKCRRHIDRRLAAEPYRARLVRQGDLSIEPVRLEDSHVGDRRATGRLLRQCESLFLSFFFRVRQKF